MRGVNKVILVGSVGKDPEVKYMPSGGAVVNLNIATNESWKDKQTGEKKERTEWHRLTFYNRLAEVVGEYVRKGQPIYVEGKLRTRDYEKEGQKHYVTEILVDDLQMLGGKGQRSSGPDSATPAHGPMGAGREQQASGGGGGDGADFHDDDIPFISKSGLY